MFRIISILLNQHGGTLAVTRKTSNTLITAAGFNTNYDEIEAVVNALTADNLAADSVTAVKVNADIVRADYGLKQHTDGSLFVDVSDTNPGLEITDGGVRAKVYGMVNRTSNGLTIGRSGDLLLSSNTNTPDGWTDVSTTYDNKFIRIGDDTPLTTTGGADTHDHGAATGSHILTIAEMPAHTHKTDAGQNGGGAEMGSQRWTSGVDDGTSSDSTGGGGGHTHTVSSVDNIPAYIQTRLYKKD